MLRHFEREGPDRGLRLRFDVQETRGGGVLWISSGRNDRMGAKMKTPKNSLGFKQNPKNPGPKFDPQKIPRRIFEP